MIEVINDILHGKHDADLPAIAQAISMRKRVLGTSTFHEMKVGDRVRIVDSVKPTYLAGAIGTIVKKNVTKVVVDLDEPVHGPNGGYFYHGIRTAVSLLELTGERVTRVGAGLNRMTGRIPHPHGVEHERG